MGERLQPWWDRWPGWWEEQKAQLRHRWGPGFGFEIDDRLHRVAWRGHLGHPVDGTTEVPVAIHWGPGTPFFPPRFFFVGLTSAVHQLSDGSLCLLPPSDPIEGWEGLLDITHWMERAEEWLRRYFDEQWALPPMVWAITSLRLPGYRYRQLVPERRLIALPPSWADMAPGFGRVAVALPSDGGLGAVVSWGDEQGRRVDWVVGQQLMRGRAEAVVEGIWARFSGDPRAGVQYFTAPSMNRRFTRLSEKEVERGLRDRASTVELFAYELDLHGGPGLTWGFALKAAPGPSESRSLLAQILSWGGAELERGHGFPLEQSLLDKRRRAGRSDAMHDKISRTQVILVGLGSLGSEVAHLLAQEGIQAFYLVDGDLLLPGNEARHRAGLVHAGRAKVKVVEDLIREIQPEATVIAHQGWIDEVATQLQKTTEGWDVLIVGATGDEATEHFLGDLARDLDVPCVHGWLELDGTVLRAMRYLPGFDPSISKVQGLPETPRLEASGDADGPRICADTVLPGSALNIHASANFLVRVALDIITEEWSNENHWLFAPGGTKAPGAPDTLRRPYGTIAVELPD